MGKFADILPAVLEGADARDPALITAIDGKTPIKCDLCILMPADDADIEEAAVDFAKAHKVVDPKPGNSQYERGLMLHTLLRACVDDEVKGKREPYFASLEQIGKYLDDGRAAVLFFQQRAFQKKVSPNPYTGQKPEEYLLLGYASAKEREAGGDPALPFVGLPYGTLVNFCTESVRILFVPPPPSSGGGSAKPD